MADSVVLHGVSDDLLRVAVALTCLGTRACSGRTSSDLQDSERHTDLVGDHKGFTVVLQGYDIAEVDTVLERIRKAVASTDRAFRASVRGELNHPALRVRLRGYDRIEVDDYLRRAIDRLA